MAGLATVTWHRQADPVKRGHAETEKAARIPQDAHGQQKTGHVPELLGVGGARSAGNRANERRCTCKAERGREKATTAAAAAIVPGGSFACAPHDKLVGGIDFRAEDGTAIAGIQPLGHLHRRFALRGER